MQKTLHHDQVRIIPGINFKLILEKSINEIHHINWIKDKDYMIESNKCKISLQGSLIHSQ